MQALSSAQPSPGHDRHPASSHPARARRPRLARPGGHFRPWAAGPLAGGRHRRYQCPLRLAGVWRRPGRIRGHDSGRRPRRPGRSRAGLSAAAGATAGHQLPAATGRRLCRGHGGGWRPGRIHQQRLGVLVPRHAARPGPGRTAAAERLRGAGDVVAAPAGCAAAPLRPDAAAAGRCACRGHAGRRRPRHRPGRGRPGAHAPRLGGGAGRRRPRQLVGRRRFRSMCWGRPPTR